MSVSAKVWAWKGMSDSYDGTPEETADSKQKPVIINQKRLRCKREKPVSYFEKCEM